MIRSEDLRFFAVVSAEPSLAAAARTLNVTPSAVTQRLKALEALFGFRLTHRNGRQMILTEEGHLLAERGGNILREMDALSETVQARRQTISGNLRVLAPFGFGRQHVASICADFQQQYPAVTVDLFLSGKLGRHPDQPWDVAVHIGQLADSTLRARKLARNKRLLCASPLYLVRHAPPRVPSDLLDHACIVLRENDEDSTLWRFQDGSDAVSVRVSPALTTNDGSVARQWALDGHGILIRSEWDVANDLRNGALVELLPSYRLPSADIVLLTSASAERTGRVTAFSDLLAERLSALNW